LWPAVSFFPETTNAGKRASVLEHDREGCRDNDARGAGRSPAQASAVTRTNGSRQDCGGIGLLQRGVMPLVIAAASHADAAAIAAVRMAAARDLTVRFGAGTWSFAAETEASVRAELRTSTVLFARDAGLVVGTLRLAIKGPWTGRTDFFSPSDRPIYLTSMAVAPKRQREGIGRQLLDEARRVALSLRGDAIRLDSYDAPAGAGSFYLKCGFREVHRAEYNGTPLIWFETPLQDVRQTPTPELPSG
jgi:GNAT superfamily N-acetyltransferase